MAYGIDHDIGDALVVILGNYLLHHLEHVGIEATAERAVARIDHEGHALHLVVSLLEEACGLGGGNEERLEDMLQKVFVGKHILDGNLSMVKFGRRNHLHGTRNLTGAIDTGYAGLYLFQ